MSMRTMALTFRSIRTENRSHLVHALRLGVLLLLALSLTMAQITSWQFGAPGMMMFAWLVNLNLLAIMLVGLSLFASVIAEEKELMTLGLLKMTGLNPLSILLGKSVSRLFTFMMLLFIQVPFTVLAITLGGVSIHQILAAYTLMAAFTLFVFGIALFASVISPRVRIAASITFLMLLGFFVLPPLMMGLIAELSRLGYFPEGSLLYTALHGPFNLLYDISVYSGMGLVLQGGFSESLLSKSVIGNLLVGLVLFLISWALFNPCTRNTGAESSESRPFLSRGKRGRLLKPGRAWNRWSIWLGYYFHARGIVGMIGRLVIYSMVVLLLMMLSMVESRRLDIEFLGSGTMVLAMVLAVVELAVLAGRIFREDINAGTLSSVAITPGGIRNFVYGKVLGSLTVMIPTLLLFFIGASLALDEFVEAVVEMAEEGGVVIFFLGNILLICHLVAFVSLWVKWGALPLTLIGYLIMMQFFSVLMFAISFAGGPSEEAIMGFIGSMMIFVSLLLHPLIGVRLKVLATRD